MKVIAIAMMLVMSAARFALASDARPGWTTVHPADCGLALENPGMGWVFHHYDNTIDGYGPPLGPGYDGHEFPGLAVAYLRLAWSYLEPQEGQFNWSILDTPIQRYRSAGKRFAFRFTVFEGHPKHGTPDWVRDAGAKGHIVETYKIKSWEPDYDDPIFLAKLEKFLKAAAARYDGSPDLAFVDVGTLGIWGEGHPIARRYGLETLRRHIEIHRRAFPRALLVAGDDWTHWFRSEGGPDTAALDLARKLGLAFRDDSLCVYPDPKQDYSAALAQPFWPDHPVILEMGHYGHAKQVKAWGDGSRYQQAMEDYHASYVSVHANPIVFLAENKDVIGRMNRRLGYRIKPAEVAWPAVVKTTEKLTVEARWWNAGVAPCLPGGHVAWSLRNSKGELCAVLVDDQWNARELTPEPSQSATGACHSRAFGLPPHCAAGEYKLYVSIGTLDGSPRLALPLEGDDGQHRYLLGTIELR